VVFHHDICFIAQDWNPTLHVEQLSKAVNIKKPGQVWKPALLIDVQHLETIEGDKKDE